MEKLREHLNELLHDFSAALEQDPRIILGIAKQMDALLEECYQALQCPIKSQVMIELLKNNGYGQ